MSRWPCKDYLRGTCNNSFCERWHPPECLFYKTKSGCPFGEEVLTHRQVDEQCCKKSETNDDKSAVTILKKGKLARMITGISMDLETCLILGQVSHNLLCWKKNLLTDTCRPGGEKRENNLHPGQIICGQSSGNHWESTPS